MVEGSESKPLILDFVHYILLFKHYFSDYILRCSGFNKGTSPHLNSVIELFSNYVKSDRNFNF